MRLINLSEKLLKSMVKSYSETGQRLFVFDFFKTQYADIADDFISDALYLLQSDGFASIAPGDNIAYCTTLLVDGIRNCEENTLIKKGYTIIKEIRSLI